MFDPCRSEKKKKREEEREEREEMELIFISLGILSSILVVASSNAVHSVLYLVLVFCNSAGLLILQEVEFIGLLLLIVYVGAVAVLFLFVVMMLIPRESKEGEARGKYIKQMMVMGAICTVYMTGRSEINEINERNEITSIGLEEATNIERIGQIMYTYNVYYFLVAGLILLVAMLGAIGLTGGVKEE